MQAGKIDRSEKFTNNSHHRARHIRCRADEIVNHYNSLARLLLLHIFILHGVTAVELLIIHKRNGGSDYAE